MVCYACEMSNIKKHKIKIILILIIIISTVFAVYFSNSSKVNYKNKLPKIDENTLYPVVRVIDGDTFDTKVGKQTVRVRMLGVNTPETVDPRKPVECFGKEASEETKGLLVKHSVKLQTDSTQSLSDKFGRLLAYVYRDDGLFINEYLVENGYAHEYTYDIPYQKQVEFKKKEKTASESKEGLWGRICNGKLQILTSPLKKDKYPQAP